MDTSVANALERMRRSFWQIFGRGRVKGGNDTGGVQMLQVQLSDREVRDNTPRVAEYGFASMPLPGCQALVVFVGGDRSNAAIVGTNDETHRMKNLQPGEVAIYDDQGQSVYITRSGIVIDGAGKTISITNAPHVTHDGVNIGKDHVHSGVTPGAGTTGVPQ